MSTKTPPPSPKHALRPPWRVDVTDVGGALETASPSLPVPPPPPAQAPAFVAAPMAPLPPAPAPPADSAPSDAHKRIRASASKGGSLKALHTLFSVSAETFKHWLDAEPGLRRAFDEGKELEREALHRTLYEAAIFKRDLNAAQFLLKSRHAYREQEPEDTRNKISITFNIPAAAPDLKTYSEQNGRMEAVPLPRAPRVIDHD